MTAKENPEAADLGVEVGDADGGSDLSSVRLTQNDAARLTTKIQLRLDTIADNVEAVLPLIEQARSGNAHAALGYRSWTEFVTEKFGGALSRLGKVERLPLVELLADQGMSTRAIASVVGVSNATVSRDLAAVTDVTPAEIEMANATDEFEQALDLGRADGDLSQDNVVAKISSITTNNVIGIDGKSYSRTGTTTKHRPALVGAYRDASRKLFKLAETVGRLHKDDRFAANADTLLDRNRFELLQTYKLITAICRDLGVDTGAEPPICRDCGDKLVLGPESRLRELAAARAVRHAADGGHP